MSYCVVPRSRGPHAFGVEINNTPSMRRLEANTNDYSGRDRRGRRRRRHLWHDVAGPRRRRQRDLERRERVALDAQEEGPVAAERVDEGRLGVRRRDLGRGQCVGQRGEQLLRRRRAAELLRQNVERRDEGAELSARGAAPRDHSERRRRGAGGRRPLRDGGRRVRRREAREDRGVARFLRRLIVLLVVGA